MIINEKSLIFYVLLKFQLNSNMAVNGTGSTTDKIVGVTVPQAPKEDSFMNNFAKNIQWTKGQSRNSGAWLEVDEFRETFSVKHLNYELEEAYMNDNDVFKSGDMIKNLMKNQSRQIKKRKAVDENADFATGNVFGRELVF